VNKLIYDSNLQLPYPLESRCQRSLVEHLACKRNAIRWYRLPPEFAEARHRSNVFVDS